MINSSKFYLELIQPGIIKVCSIDGLEIELEDANEMILAATDLAGGKEYVTVFDARNVASISNEAREAFALSPKRIAAAVLVNTLANKLVANFLYNFTNPFIQLEFFPMKLMHYVG